MTGTAFRSYMICTVPRSGSTLLCRLLAATKIAGDPDSHFHAPSLQTWLQDYNLNETDFTSKEKALRAVFNAAVARGKGTAEIFGLRMQRGSFEHFMQQLERLFPTHICDAERIGAAFGPTLYIHLSRADRLDQAISRVRAEQTGLWHRNSDGSELERRAPPQDARYDPHAIAQHMAELAALDEAWERWFEREAITPLRIRYAELSADPRGVLAKLLCALQLDPTPAQFVEIPTAKLADAVSQKWREQFEREGTYQS